MQAIKGHRFRLTAKSHWQGKDHSASRPVAMQWSQPCPTVGRHRSVKLPGAHDGG